MHFNRQSHWEPHGKYMRSDVIGIDECWLVTDPDPHHRSIPNSSQVGIYYEILVFTVDLSARTFKHIYVNSDSV